MSEEIEKKFIVKIKTFPSGIDSEDLYEAISDGLDNVGNFDLKDLEVEGIK